MVNFEKEEEKKLFKDKENAAYSLIAAMIHATVWLIDRGIRVDGRNYLVHVAADLTIVITKHYAYAAKHFAKYGQKFPKKTRGSKRRAMKDILNSTLLTFEQHYKNAAGEQKKELSFVIHALQFVSQCLDTGGNNGLVQVSNFEATARALINDFFHEVFGDFIIDGLSYDGQVEFLEYDNWDPVFDRLAKSTSQSQKSPETLSEGPYSVPSSQVHSPLETVSPESGSLEHSHPEPVINHHAKPGSQSHKSPVTPVGEQNDRNACDDVNLADSQDDAPSVDEDFFLHLTDEQALALGTENSLKYPSQGQFTSTVTGGVPNVAGHRTEDRDLALAVQNSIDDMRNLQFGSLNRGLVIGRQPMPLEATVVASDDKGKNIAVETSGSKKAFKPRLGTFAATSSTNMNLMQMVDD